MKQLIALLFFVMLSVAAQAQDVIFFKDGHTMDVHVKKITGSLIYYSADPGAPQRYIYKKKVEKIVYERGREVVFKESRKQKQSLTDAHHVLTLAPVNLLVFGRGTGLGIGLDYEHFIGERHLISVRLPFYAGFTTNEDPYYDYLPYEDGVFLWTAPGVRFHWLKPTSKADLATGLSVVVGNAKMTYYPNDGFGTPKTTNQFLMTAVTLDNDFTVYTKRKVAFGVHTAFGPVFGGDSAGSNWMVQIGFKIGRRF